MKKSTLLTLALALSVSVANADEKVIYQDYFTDAATSLANWTNSRGGDATTTTTVQSTSDGNFLQIGNGVASFNGTRFSTVWGSTPWEGVTIPETGYTMDFYFNFAKFGSNSSAAAQRNNEIAILNATNADAAKTTFPSAYYGNAKDVFPDYIFKLTQSLNSGGVATSQTGTCYFLINNEKDSVNIAAGTWYKVKLTVTGQKVDYNIVDISDTPFKSGSYTLADGVDSRVGGIAHYQARYQGITQFMNIKVSYLTDEDVANKPTVLLSQVKGNDRVYKATFAEGETLHYILPGGTEQELDYWDAEDEITGNPGTATLVATQSGTMKVWTTKNEAVSDVVSIDVTAGRIKLVDPVVAITSVNEGFAKSYSVSIDNSQVLLSPTIALSYTIKYTDGSSESGEISNGGTLKLTKAGTFTITANTIPVNGVEYYDRSSITVENDVEYVVAKDVKYHEWTGDQLAATGIYTKTAWTDTNTSHWSGKWMNAYTTETKDAAGNNTGIWWKAPSKVFSSVDEANAYIQVYTLNNDADGVNYKNALLPLIPNTARANVAILVEEGIFVNGTTYNNLELTFDPSYVTDNPAKPNFIEINKVNSYDRYDKQPGCRVTDIVKTDVTTYTLYRFDTAINSVRVFTYKGFVPGNTSTGIKTVADQTNNADAPIYTISGVRVNKGNLPAGIYIQNGKKFVVK